MRDALGTSLECGRVEWTNAARKMARECLGNVYGIRIFRVFYRFTLWNKHIMWNRPSIEDIEDMSVECVWNMWATLLICYILGMHGRSTEGIEIE